MYHDPCFLGFPKYFLFFIFDMFLKHAFVRVFFVFIVFIVLVLFVLCCVCCFPQTNTYKSKAKQQHCLPRSLFKGFPNCFCMSLFIWFVYFFVFCFVFLIFFYFDVLCCVCCNWINKNIQKQNQTTTLFTAIPVSKVFLSFPRCSLSLGPIWT